MDIAQIVTIARQASLALTLKDARYDSLTPEQRSSIEQSLGYFDYFNGYDAADDEAAKRRKFDAAVHSFLEDTHLDKLPPNQQFIAILVPFLQAMGIDVDGLLGNLLPPEVAAANPSRQWERNSGPRAGQPIALPRKIETGALGTSLAVPQGEAETNGRYRLATVANQANGRATATEMVVLNPQGEVVWRSPMYSGSSNLDSLPGLRTAIPGKPITAEYKIAWDDVRMNRRDPLAMRGMSYSNGQPGFSFSLTNPDNIAELGGAGRGAFRIHPGGRSRGTAGCLEFVDSNGQVNETSDRAAREFAELMTSLPPAQRPVSLEILNATMLGKAVANEVPRVAAAPDAPKKPALEPHPLHDKLAEAVKPMKSRVVATVVHPHVTPPEHGLLDSARTLAANAISGVRHLFG